MCPGLSFCENRAQPKEVKLLEAAGTSWGISGLAFLGLAIAAVVMARGRLRLLTGVTALMVAAFLLAVAIFTPEEYGEEPDFLAALQNPEGYANPGAEAQELMATAEQALNRGNDTAAAEMFARAGGIFREQGNTRGEADVFLGLGRLRHVTGQTDEARFNYDQALALFRRTGDLASEAVVLAARGDLEKDTFNWTEAQRSYNEAREVWARAPEPKNYPHVVLAMADSPMMPDGEAAARKVLQQAVLIFEQIGDLEAQGDAIALSGALNWNLGLASNVYADHIAAEALFRSAGVLAKAGESALWQARASIRIGYNASADAALGRAAGVFADLDDSLGTARAEVTRGDLERLQGRMAEALTAYASGAETLRSHGHPEAAAAYLKLGELEAFLGNADSARAALEESESLSRAGGNLAGESAANLERGALAIAGGEDPAAEALFGAALEFYRAAGDAHGEGRVLLAQAAQNAASGNSESARAAYLESAARFAAAAVPFGHLIAVLGLGDLEWADGNASGAADAYRAANGFLRELADPVAAANLLLGLPPVGSLFVASATEFHADPFEVPDPLPPAEAQAQNLQQFPEHNAEARALVEATTHRIADNPAFTIE